LRLKESSGEKESAPKHLDCGVGRDSGRSKAVLLRLVQ
jgi:hypothetical protein